MPQYKNVTTTFNEKAKINYDLSNTVTPLKSLSHLCARASGIVRRHSRDPSDPQEFQPPEHTEQLLTLQRVYMNEAPQLGTHAPENHRLAMLRGYQSWLLL
jgi:hypothetical protein